MGNFCMIFFQKVKQAFPQDTPEDTLEKLVVMWRKHTKAREFGIYCRDDCSCVDSWERLFLPACTDMKRDSPSKQSSHTNGVLEDIVKTSVFEVIFNPSKQTLGFYCVTKRSTCGNGWDCLIISVDPKGSSQKKDPRIRFGTVVEFFEVVGNTGVKQAISSYSELKDIYMTSKQKKGARLKLYFKILLDSSGYRNLKVQKE